jgi:hypothetical protein
MCSQRVPIPFRISKSLTLLSTSICALLFAVIALVVSGCGGHEGGPTNSSGREGIGVLSPSSLFVGDLRGLEPHLGISASTRVNVEFTDPSWTVKILGELWKKGEKDQRMDLLETSMAVEEVSVSLRDNAGDDDCDLAVVLRHPNGSASFPVRLHKPSEAKVFSPKEISGKIIMEPQSETPIWGYMAGSALDEPGGHCSLDEIARRAEWAFVLKLGPVKRKTRTVERD